MLKIVFINLLFAFSFVWITVCIILSQFPSCYESQASALQQDIAYINSCERNQKAQDIPIKQTINTANSDQQYLCKRWAVVRATSYPTNAVRKIASDNNWCLVIVADINTPSKDEYLTTLGYSGRKIVFLNVADQDILFSDISTAIPWGHIGRKNVGYLFAIQKGAEWIWDFDHNNEGVLDINIINNLNTMSVLQTCRGHHKLFNPYAYFGVNETYIWPRGFPLEFARDTSTRPNLCNGNIAIKSVIANREPDVDATFRFSREYPITFEATQTFPFILVPRYSHCPFNERATLWTKQAFYYMALPTSIHSRVSDIWRSYIAQHFFHREEINLLFSPPYVVQTNGDQNILEDFQAEMDIYKKSSSLIDFLQTFQFQPNATLENLYEELYIRHFIQLEDIYLIRIWTRSYSKVSGSS
ncbi:hypothetical protein CHS0354_003596 [Potamilus streckersoni]|uniref:Uncharacterized protein n=1 Tax=Potamilus streckersoni TaxID=2493646 RepID=A0AAE0RYK7_9BIVA|nr:hypothetical protein CHS0354_003596 [Potamilus streckersoni]